MVAIRAVNGTSQVPMEPVTGPALVTAPAQGAGRQPAADAGKSLPPAGEEPPPVSVPSLERAADEVERYVQSLQRRLQFSIDEESGRTVIRVIDRETDQVIRQIPGEEMLALSRRLRETAGLLLSEQA